MLQPKKTKFRKQAKGRNRGLANVGNKVSFGDFGLQATTRGRITARQIEAARRAISRHLKRGGKMWIRIFPDKPITKKPTAQMRRNLILFFRLSNWIKFFPTLSCVWVPIFKNGDSGLYPHRCRYQAIEQKWNRPISDAWNNL